MQQILIICRHSALTGSLAREAQDMAMALAALDHQVSLLYLGEAVLQLLPRSHSPAVKDFTLAQKLFALYDIDQVYVCAQALARFGIDKADLRIPCQAVPAEGALLLAQFQQILVY